MASFFTAPKRDEELAELRRRSEEREQELLAHAERLEQERLAEERRRLDAERQIRDRDEARRRERERPQCPRAFGAVMRLGSEAFFVYVFLATIAVFEGAGGLAFLDDVAHEFKEMNVALTSGRLAVEAEWKRLVAAFTRRILENACAALNARCNMTLHLGIKDNGKIMGLLVERYDLIGRLNEAVRKHLDGPEYLGFRNHRGRIAFSQKMRDAFGRCVSNLQPVRVVGDDGTGEDGDGSMDRYVLEVDITPSSAICEDMVFACAHSGGKVRRLIRQGSQNNSDEEVNKRGGNFNDEVQKNATWRQQQDGSQQRQALAAQEEKIRARPEAELSDEENGFLMLISNVIRQLDELINSNVISSDALRRLLDFRTPDDALEAFVKSEAETSERLPKRAQGDDDGFQSGSDEDEDMRAGPLDAAHAPGAFDGTNFDKLVLSRSGLRLRAELTRRRKELSGELRALQSSRFEYRANVKQDYLEELCDIVDDIDDFTVVAGSPAVAKEGSILLQRRPEAERFDFECSDEPGKAIILQLHHDIREGATMFSHFGTIPLKAWSLDGDSPLHLAAKVGNVTAFKSMMIQASKDEIGTVVNEPNDEGLTPLHLCAMNDHGDIAQAIVDSGYAEEPDARVDDGGDGNATALLVAAAAGSASVAGVLLSLGDHVDPNATYGESGASALNFAAANGFDGVVRHLLARDDADVNMADRRGMTPLNSAASGDFDNVVCLLLDRPDIDVNAADKNGRTPLINAILHGVHHERKYPRRSHQRNRSHYDPSYENLDPDSGLTPFGIGAWGSRLDVLSVLLARDDVDVNKADHDGFTPLLHAIRVEREDAVETVLAHDDVYLNLAGRDSLQPIHVAASSGHAGILKRLLDSGADVNATDGAGSTALCLAAANGHVGAISVLLSFFGVEVDAADCAGETPLIRAAAEGRVGAVEILLRSGVDVDRRTKKGETALTVAMLACSEGARNGKHAEVVRLLVEDGGADLRALFRADFIARWNVAVRGQLP